MSGHTKTPWYFGNMPGWGDCCVLRRPASDYGPTGTVGDAPLAILVERAPHWEGSYPMLANAAHIVRCVNSHDALLAACEAAEPVFGDAVSAFVAARIPGWQKLDGVRKQLQAAIAAARGEAT